MSNHRYDVTARGVMEWAKSELEHVGRIASVKDKDLQYSYAMSTVYGMAHLKDALKQLVDDENYEHKRADLLKLHDAVVRVMKKLVGDYGINLNAVREFNERGVLSNLGYLNEEEGESMKKSRHSANMANSNSWRKSEWMNEDSSSEEESDSDSENNMNTESQNGGKRRLRYRKTRRAAAGKHKAKRGTRRR